LVKVRPGGPPEKISDVAKEKSGKGRIDQHNNQSAEV